MRKKGYVKFHHGAESIQGQTICFRINSENKGERNSRQHSGIGFWDGSGGVGGRN